MNSRVAAPHLARSRSGQRPRSRQCHVVSWTSASVTRRWFLCGQNCAGNSEVLGEWSQAIALARISSASGARSRGRFKRQDTRRDQARSVRRRTRARPPARSPSRPGPAPRSRTPLTTCTRGAAHLAVRRTSGNSGWMRCWRSWIAIAMAGCRTRTSRSSVPGTASPRRRGSAAKWLRFAAEMVRREDVRRRTWSVTDRGPTNRASGRCSLADHPHHRVPCRHAGRRWSKRQDLPWDPRALRHDYWGEIGRGRRRC